MKNSILFGGCSSKRKESGLYERRLIFVSTTERSPEGSEFVTTKERLVDLRGDIHETLLGMENSALVDNLKNTTASEFLTKPISVMYLQLALSRLGHNPLGVDGYYAKSDVLTEVKKKSNAIKKAEYLDDLRDKKGGDTMKAVLAFQRSADGFPSNPEEHDGICGSKTIAKIIAALEKKTPTLKPKEEKTKSADKKTIEKTETVTEQKARILAESLKKKNELTEAMSKWAFITTGVSGEIVKNNLINFIENTFQGDFPEASGFCLFLQNRGVLRNSSPNNTPFINYQSEEDVKKVNSLILEYKTNSQTVPE